jgi:chemotaxis protein methyltransferase CheR
VSDELRALARVVHELSGLALRDSHLDSLRAALRRLEPGLTPGDLLRDPDRERKRARLDRLVDQVTVNETFLNRHLEELEQVDWQALTARAAAEGRHVRVWSAACSSGEEACSLAMLATERLGSARPPVDILGTDISPTAIALAQRGIYGPRSSRLIDAERRARWFHAEGHGLRVGAELRALMRFARHNLVRDQLPPPGEDPFDLIVCRNVLIYFDEPTVAKVIAGLRAALTRHGMLLLGTVDRLGAKPDREAPPPQRPRPARTVPPPAPAPATRRGARAAAVPLGQAGPAHAPAAGPPRANDAHASFEAGLQALSDGDVVTAVEALRRALYLDPGFAVAALQLARAYELLGDLGSAERAYARTLRLTEDADDLSARVYDRVGAGDVAAACRARLAVLASQRAAR